MHERSTYGGAATPIGRPSKPMFDGCSSHRKAPTLRLSLSMHDRTGCGQVAATNRAPLASNRAEPRAPNHGLAAGNVPKRGSTCSSRINPFGRIQSPSQVGMTVSTQPSNLTVQKGPIACEKLRHKHVAVIQILRSCSSWARRSIDSASLC